MVQKRRQAFHGSRVFPNLATKLPSDACTVTHESYEGYEIVKAKPNKDGIDLLYE